MPVVLVVPAVVGNGVVIAGAGDRALLHSIVPGAPRTAIAVPPGTGRTLSAAGGLLTASTRSLGERVSVHDLATGRAIATLRGVSTGVPAPPYVVATGREGTVVAGP